MPRPWISRTGEPSRAPQASYAMRTPSLVTIALTGSTYRLLEELRDRVSHCLAETRRGERVTRVVRVGKSHQRTEPDVPGSDRQPEGPAGRHRHRHDRRGRHRLQE